MAKIIILDYDLGNLFSVKHACMSLGMDVSVSQSPKDVENCDGLILPGVGAFNEAMNNLENLQLISPILNHVKANKPLFGICLGLQLLFTKSEEYVNRNGLGLIAGDVIKFPNQINDDKLVVPQIGWNTIRKNNSISRNFDPLNGLKENEFVYFVHSYFVKPTDPNDVLTFTNYDGLTYCSSVLKNNIFATQFHPEKSGVEGLKIYKNWADQNNLI